MALAKNKTLDELYESEKITPGVKKYILLKEDFSKFSPRWCQKVCKVSDKKPPPDYILTPSPVDVLIVRDFFSLPDVRFKRPAEDVDRKLRNIYNFLRQTLPQGMTSAMTELVKCHTENPTDVEKQTTMLGCSPYLKTEIAQYKPKVIISLATAVTKAMGLNYSNSSDAGRIVDYQGTPVVLTLNPRILTMVRQNSSGAFWGADFLTVIQKDYEKAGKIAKGELPVVTLEDGIKEAAKRVKVARNLEEIKEFLKVVASSKAIVSFDIETTGLDPYAQDAVILCIQFGIKAADGDYDSYVIPIFHPRVPLPYSFKESWGLVAPLLLDENLKKVGHNVKFDCMYIAVTTGVRVKGIVFDTMLLIHSLNSGLQGMYSLKTNVGYWLPETGLRGYEDELSEEPLSDDETSLTTEVGGTGNGD